MIWFNKVLKRIILSIMLGGFMICSYAQQFETNFATPSHLGMTGLIYTPSAYLPEWGMVDIGFTHYDKDAAFTFEAGNYAEHSFLANFTFLPFVEMTLKLTKPYTDVTGEHYGLGDRSISFRVQILKERKNLPAVVIGIQDPNTIQAFFNTNYIVLTKKYHLNNFAVVANLGYGLLIEETNGDYLEGVFGGVQMHWKKFNFIAEYDTDQFNLGVGYQHNKRFFLKAALVNGRYPTGSINLRFFIR